MAPAAEKKTPEKKAAKKDRPALKARLKSLKRSREEAKESKDDTALARIRRRYRRATHALRRTAAPKAKAAKKE